MFACLDVDYCLALLRRVGSVITCPQLMRHRQVKRDVWQDADSQAKTFKDESSALKMENDALGQQLKKLQTLVAGMVATEEVTGLQTLRHVSNIS